MGSRPPDRGLGRAVLVAKEKLSGATKSLEMLASMSLRVCWRPLEVQDGASGHERKSNQRPPFELLLQGVNGRDGLKH